MLLNDRIVASYVEGFSGVYIHCPVQKKDEIASKFSEIFEDAWNEAMDAVEEEYDECTEKEDEIGNPVSVNTEGEDILLYVDPLFLSFNEYEGVDNEYGPEAFENSLKELKTIYPEIEYEGLVAYEWCDSHGSDVVSYEIHSGELLRNNNKTYGFVKKTLLEQVENDEFWDKLEDRTAFCDEDDFKLILRDFHIYEMPQEAIDRLLDIAEQVDDSYRETLETIIEAWNNGEDVEIKEPEIDTSGFPEGYMDELLKYGKENNCLRYDDDDPDYDDDQEED